MPKRLLVLAGPDEGREFLIPASDSLLLGRSRATETRLIDPHVSRVHCSVQMENSDLIVSDFDSAGGTYVDGKRVEGKAKAKAGALIRIGNTRLQYLDEEGETKSGPLPVAVPVKTSSARFPDSLVGEKFSNFTLGPMLAKGQTGFVFHGRDVRQDQPVAMKVLEPEFSQDKKAVARFVKAMKMVMPLRHDNLVAVYSAGKTGPYCWVAMEYFPSESLAAVIGRIPVAGTLDWHQVLLCAILLSRGLEYAHSKQIVHRNITPQNILIGSTPGSVKLLDLMLANAIEGYLARQLSRQGDLLVDIPYMSPERASSGQVEVDHRTDIYSLGATLYAMLCGQPPFTGETITELVMRIRRDAPTPLKDYFLGAPKQFEAAIMRMMQKEPNDRYQSATELREELELLAKSQKVSVPAEAS